MRVRIQEVELHVTRSGEGDPVLLVHGFPLSSHLWRETMQRLPPGWSGIAPDLRGHGETEATPEISLLRLARDLVELLDALGETRPVVLVGLSMGGYVALEMARRWSDRIRALVLVDTRAEADSAEAAAGRLRTAERVLHEGSSVVAEAMAPKLFAPGADPELVRDWTERMAATAPSGVAAALRAMAHRGDNFDVLRSWKEPLLVVVGEHDAITPPEAARAMAEAAPAARLEIVPGAGHLTPVEQPERFSTLLADFLTRLPPLTD
jgi:3-oxoadipate enol-lactonase